MEHWKMGSLLNIDKMIPTIGVLHCEVCECDFAPIKELHYIARDPNGMFSESKYYDAFDCPLCGSQIIVGERKRCAVDITDLVNDRDEGACAPSDEK